MRRLSLPLPGLLILGATVFFTGIHWGLPSRAVDPYLFGSHPIWTGQQIAQLLPPREDNRGADVDINPIRDRSHPILLNDTDQQRAEMIRRYRLFSYQPDEMITFMALSSMHPSSLDLDPRLYQYGGLWIYPVGALLKAAALVGLVELRPDQTYYLDHPESFGRFYIVARAYSAAWGLLGVCCIFWITHRLTASPLAASAAALCFIFMPVVVNMAHEAKPHLPAAVLELAAVMAATKYVESGATRWWVASAILCGAAFGMVLSGAMALVILPVMVFLRPIPWRRRLIIAATALLLALGVYVLTNPYVPINSLIASRRPRLISNFSNSTAMYSPSISLGSLANAARLIAAGMTPALAICGVLAVIGLLVTVKASAPATRPVFWLLGVLATVIALQFVLLASEKPAEYARFALVPDIALSIAAITATARFIRQRVARWVALIVLPLTAVPGGCSYLVGFLRDCTPASSRLMESQRFQHLPPSVQTIGVYAEPAPYTMPPLDLYRFKLLLLPSLRDVPADADISLRPAGMPPYLIPDPTPLSWADKPFEVIHHIPAPPP